MDPVFAIALWAALFLGSHLLISSRAVRPRLIAMVGEQAYQGIYSIVALATFVPLVLAFAYHKHSGAMLWNLRDVPALRYLVWLLMLLALIIFIASFITPNPGSMGALGEDKKASTARGVQQCDLGPGIIRGIEHVISKFDRIHIGIRVWRRSSGHVAAYLVPYGHNFARPVGKNVASSVWISYEIAGFSSGKPSGGRYQTSDLGSHQLKPAHWTYGIRLTLQEALHRFKEAAHYDVHAVIGSTGQRLPVHGHRIGIICACVAGRTEHID